MAAGGIGSDRHKRISHVIKGCLLVPLKVHKREKFFGSDFEFFTIL